MLSYSDFRAFVRTLRDEPVLTVYLSGVCHDPSATKTWQVELEHALQEIRDRLASAPLGERRRFELCVRLLLSEVIAPRTVHTSRGWVAFITPEGVRRAERLPVDVPTVATWQIGPYVTPYIRAIEQNQHAVVAIADARTVAVYRYHDDRITRQRVFEARVHWEPPLHMGDMPRQGFHPGVRGESGREATQRARDVAKDRMFRDVAAHLVRLAGADGWMLIGGIVQAVNRLVHHLPHTVLDRVVPLDGLDVHASEAMILDAARHGVSIVQNAAAAQRVAHLMATANHTGRIALDPQAVQQALAQSRVHELYVTPHYLHHDPDAAEGALRMAIDQRAAIHLLTTPAEHLLDTYGGVAAQLRYGLSDAESSFPFSLTTTERHI